MKKLIAAAVLCATAACCAMTFLADQSWADPNVINRLEMSGSPTSGFNITIPGATGGVAPSSAHFDPGLMPGFGGGQLSCPAGNPGQCQIVSVPAPAAFGLSGAVACPAGHPDQCAFPAGTVGGAAAPGGIDYLEIEGLGAVSATDNTALFQQAATALCARSTRGGTVHLRGRVYNFTPKASITASCPITWEGQGWSEAPLASGTWLHITIGGSTANGGVSLFALGAGDAGQRFSRLAVSEDQPAPPTTAGSSWAPTPYPAVFNAQGANGGIFLRDIMAAPVYDLISSVRSGRTDFCGIYGQILHSAALIDLSYDTTHASCGAMHFWPYWSTNDYVLSYTAQNADILTLGRIDGGVFPDIFAYGYRSVVHFVTSPNAQASDNLGSAVFASRLSFGSLYADSVERPVWVNGGVQATAIYYPNNITFDNIFATGYGVGSPVSGNNNLAGFTASTVAMPGSYGILVDSNGAIEMNVGHLSVEATTGPSVSLTNTSLPSSIRVGSIHERKSAGYVFYSPNGGAAGQSDISVATRPDVDLTMFGPPGSLTTVNIPRLPSYAQTVVASTTYQFGLPSGATYENDPETLVLTAAGSVAGVTVNLPAGPYNGQTAKIVSTVALTGFSLTSGQTIVGAAAPTTLSASVPISYQYVSGMGWVRTS